jgi:hypothetical protein
MVDRPIIFSGPMVRALLAGRKTQTRRLATSPLRRVNAGDRLYVREHWKTSMGNDGVAPRDLDPETSILMLADGVVPTRFNLPPWGKHRQGMHMPRWASRLTLVIEQVRVERLQLLTASDAIAEGVEMESADPPFYYVPEISDHALTGVGIEEPGGRHAERSYGKLWDLLHTKIGERWQDNPDVVALTFRVERGNIDSIGQYPERGIA